MPGLQNSKATLDFLGTIGTTDRGSDLPLSNSAKALVNLAGFLIETATDNLQKKGHIATGDTVSSMKIVNLDLNGPVKSLDVEILSTYKFIDQGVRGTQSGTGKYAFRNNMVGRKMKSAILKWLKKRARGGKTKYRAVSKNEAKNKQINKTLQTAKSRESLAYAVATNIKKHGVPRTLFFANAIKSTQKQQKKLLGEALKIDIINSLS